MTTSAIETSAIEMPNYEGRSHMTDHAVSNELLPGPIQRVVPFLKTAALVVTILGAIPTAITVYHAWQYKVPLTQVSHRLAQYDLWVKNLDCTIDYKALNTAAGTKVDVGACAKTGDIAIKISAPDGKTTYEWIAYNQLQKPGEQPTGNFLEILIGSAKAADAGKRIELAQSSLEVVCQALSSKSKLVRIVKEGGKCFREILSPMRGTVDLREEVPCDTKCTAE